MFALLKSLGRPVQKYQAIITSFKIIKILVMGFCYRISNIQGWLFLHRSGVYVLHKTLGSVMTLHYSIYIFFLKPSQEKYQKTIRLLYNFLWKIMWHHYYNIFKRFDNIFTSLINPNSALLALFLSYSLSLFTYTSKHFVNNFNNGSSIKVPINLGFRHYFSILN